MSKKPDLSLESCWVTPEKPLSFLDEGWINLELRNNSDSNLFLEDVECTFQSEEGFDPYKVHSLEKKIIRPGCRTNVKISFCAELHVKEFTNTFSLRAFYRYKDCEPLIIQSLDGFSVINSIIIYSVRRAKYFFVSHKIPEDSTLASRLNHYLKKVGFEGFLAEADPRPGLDIWTGKIIPAIRNPDCLGLIVLWGSNAVKDPKAILRELKYGRDLDKTLIVVKQKRVEVPNSFPRKTKEYQQTIGQAIAETDLVDLVRSINKMYSEGEL